MATRFGNKRRFVVLPNEGLSGPAMKASGRPHSCRPRVPEKERKPRRALPEGATPRPGTPGTGRDDAASVRARARSRSGGGDRSLQR